MSVTMSVKLRVCVVQWIYALSTRARSGWYVRLVFLVTVGALPGGCCVMVTESYTSRSLLPTNSSVKLDPRTRTRV